MPNKIRMDRLVEHIRRTAKLFGNQADVDDPDEHGDVYWESQPDWNMQEDGDGWVYASDAKRYVVFYLFEHERHQHIVDSEFVIGGWADDEVELARQILDADDHSPTVFQVVAVDLDLDRRVHFKIDRHVIFEAAV